MRQNNSPRKHIVTIIIIIIEGRDRTARTADADDGRGTIAQSVDCNGE